MKNAILAGILTLALPTYATENVIVVEQRNALYVVEYECKKSPQLERKHIDRVFVEKLEERKPIKLKTKRKRHSCVIEKVVQIT